MQIHSQLSEVFPNARFMLLAFDGSDPHGPFLERFNLDGKASPYSYEAVELQDDAFFDA